MLLRLVGAFEQAVGISSQIFIPEAGLKLLAILCDMKECISLKESKALSASRWSSGRSECWEERSFIFPYASSSWWFFIAIHVGDAVIERSLSGKQSLVTAREMVDTQSGKELTELKFAFPHTLMSAEACDTLSLPSESSDVVCRWWTAQSLPLCGAIIELKRGFSLVLTKLAEVVSFAEGGCPEVCLLRVNCLEEFRQFNWMWCLFVWIFLCFAHV